MKDPLKYCRLVAAGASLLACLGCPDDGAPAASEGTGRDDGTTARTSTGTTADTTAGTSTEAGDSDGADNPGDEASGGNPSDPTGEAIWSRRGDGLGATAAVAADEDGDIAIAGVFRDTLDFGAGPMTSVGENDGFVAGFDEDGHCSWSRSFGGPLVDGARAVAFDADGNVLVAGGFQGVVPIGDEVLTSEGSLDVFVVKLDAQGNVVWARGFGLSGADDAHGIAMGPAGNVVVMGTASGSIDFGGGGLAGIGSTFVVRLDGTGDYVSGRLLEASSTHAVGVDRDDHVVIGGSFSGTIDLGTGPLTSKASTDAYVARFDPTWTPVFAHRIGDGAYTTAYTVAADGSGGVVVGGMADGNGVAETHVALDRFSPAGELEWSRRLGAAEYAAANSIAVDDAEHVIVAGYFRHGTLDLGCAPMESSPEQDEGDMFLAKLDAQGNCIWSHAFGGPGEQFAAGAAVDAEDNVIVAGKFENAVDFGVGSLVATHVPEPFVAKLRP